MCGLLCEQAHGPLPNGLAVLHTLHPLAIRGVCHGAIVSLGELKSVLLCP